MGSLRVYLFGGLALFWADQPLSPIPGTAARSLFAYLVTHRQQAHTRDLLAGTFWPDLPDATARRRLRQALWQIRQTLRPSLEAAAPPDEASEEQPILLTKGDTVQIHPNLPLWVDVESFIRHHAQGSAVKAQNLEHFERAITHYRGEFLEGYYDDWILSQRERLRDTLLDMLEHLIAGLKAQGNYEKALTYARQLAAEDSLREQAHREVMRLYHLLGRPHEALQQYQLCCQLLDDELNAAPSASTVALAGEIAAQAEIAEVPHLPVPPRQPSLPLLEQPYQIPLVGRQEERAELTRRVQLALNGGGSLVLLAGETGVGKTRFMQEIDRDAAWQGLRVAWGHSCELSAPPPYQPLVEVLANANLGQLPETWRRELGRLIPLLGTPPPAVLQPEQEKGRLLEAIARAFVALAEATPHMIILEDVHWMDPASFEALRILLPRLSSSRLLLVATFRPEELAERPTVRQAIRSLEASRIPHRLELAPLNKPETAALVQRVLDLARPAPRFSQRLFDQTEGNPFFITASLWALVEEGILHRDEQGIWNTPWDNDAADYDQLPVAANVAQSIRQRLDRLAPSVQAQLGAAAVIGRQVEFDLWAKVGRESEGAIMAIAENLVRRGLLAEVEQPPGYRFTHETIRQVVYDGLSPVRRRHWHCRVAEAMETLHPRQIEALARHYHLGQNWSQAVRYTRQAGERAQAIYANQQALDLFRQADAWLEEGRVDWPADEIARWRAELAEKQGQVYNLVGSYEAAETALSRAWQAQVARGDEPVSVRVLNQLSFLHFIQDNYAQATHYAQLALEALPEADPPIDLQAITLTHLGLSAWGQGHYDRALPPLEQARALFEQLGSDIYGWARCLNSLGLVHLEMENLEPAENCFARSLALRQKIGDRRGEAWCWHNQGRAALARGDLDAAEKRLKTAQAIFSEIQHPYGLDNCTRFLAQVEQARAAASGPYLQRELRLPRIGQPLSETDYVTITWTINQPDDQQIQGKVARRRHRLLRLLKEAEAQGAGPTYDHLAEALGVSRRTIERDMAALRGQKGSL